MLVLLGPGIQVNASEDAKTFRGSILEVIQVVMQDILPPAAIQIDVYLYLCLIQSLEKQGYLFFIPSPAKWISQVVMDIDHREARLDNFRLFGDQCNSWAICA